MAEILTGSVHSKGLPERSIEDVMVEFLTDTKIQKVPLESWTSFIPYITPGTVMLARKIRDAIEFLKLPSSSDYNPLE